MPDPRSAVSFDAIIQADRQRKKNEALANEIFGRSKQNKADARNPSRASSIRTPDLASRITKRSSSVASTNSARNTASRPSSTTPQNARASRLAVALESPHANIITPPRQPKSQGLSIKGKAGPFTVEASNFAPGTTAADIESALQSETVDDNGASWMLSCRIISTSPTVVAEMVFSERHVADRVISTYNNQRADGRILHLYLKQTGSGPTPQPISSEAITTSVSEPAASNESVNDNAMEDVELASEAPTTQDDRDRRSRRPETDSRDERRDDYADRRGDDHRDRDRERDHDRDRDRERERYVRRDDRPSGPYRGGNSYNSRPSHYGNGVGGPGQGAFGGPGSYPRGGGRMYSDNMMRGSHRGGGFGPGYRRGY
ncbi:hypothetical protein LTR47_003790 [Exophiala xenobiotica]|nr:hypothetical protein LTR41_002102 [Exophiala xenobiotica]KAK5234955.1 hypothetical protein LTR47_003790 [Exophiala xenobiotica]KAK5251957.1 hypothetical protein LTS06_003469 [Exophiala xenobiotica]KAK5346780.1 hypothetical protein LTR61_009476 [Exophiala xenobiotica]KAK5372068.1 hypothetical protein LTR11_006189 [Exophiala xenobiotica]